MEESESKESAAKETESKETAAKETTQKEMERAIKETDQKEKAVREKGVSQGCWVDASDRDLPVYKGQSMDYSSCREACKSGGYMLMGRQWDRQCFCGNAPTRKYGKATTCGDCGNLNANMYGGWSNCVYQIMLQSDETAAKEQASKEQSVKQAQAKEQSEKQAQAKETCNKKTVQVCAHANFVDCKDKKVGTYNWDQMGLGNDVISSIRVPAGVNFQGYEHGNFEGKMFNLNNDHGDLSTILGGPNPKDGNWNDSISSFKVGYPAGNYAC